MALPAVAGSASLAHVDHPGGLSGRGEHEDCTEENGPMDPETRASSGLIPAQQPRKRRRLGRLSHRQERALEELLSKGLVSVRWSAQEADVPESTLRRWLEADHPFRLEYDRRVRI